MRTLGIDLAASPTATGACVIRWSDGVAAVEILERDCTDERLMELASSVDRVGIDSPLGWPDAFIAAITAHASSEGWPGHGALDPAAYRDTLKYRATDLLLRSRGYAPLSVSADKLGVTAMRAALILQLMDDAGRSVTRDGSGDAVEVYPAAALRAWAIPHAGYKHPSKGVQAREALMGHIAEDAPWLALSDDAKAGCIASDHLLDALVSALVTRAAAVGATEPPPPDAVAQARREGWIHVPAEGSLGSLCG